MGPGLELKIIALHGFLGAAEDWAPVREAAAIPIEALDYTVMPGLRPQDADLTQWGSSFHSWLQQTHPEQKPVLLGYSQGGRLAMSAFRANPDRYAGLILLSSNPGMDDGDQAGRATRLQHDEAWAQRFERDEWSILMKDWNSQAVFAGGGVEPQRLETPAGRTIASASLRAWSLAKQPDQREVLRQAGERVLLLSGETDTKYQSLAQSVFAGLDRDSRTRVLAGAGHRVLFDAPIGVARLLREFLVQNHLR